ncbi:MAG TPA: hypothetical protein VFX64_03115 [Candidatus Nitrosotalea sp.]|nr:hypothetical protein [Candidatus Nitrosotalea sp.]
MGDTEKLIANAVGVIIEKVLMEFGVSNHSKIADILGAHHMTFSDCYKKPDVLNLALKQVFGGKYLDPVAKMKSELTGLEEDHKIEKFIDSISKA